MKIRYCACCLTFAVIAFVTADRNFTILQTSDGLNNLCALDQPTWSVRVDGVSVEPCVPAVISCAAKCMSDPDCGSFNYNTNSHACDIYHGTVTNYSFSTTCLHYTHSSTSRGFNCPAVAYGLQPELCSFPFTDNGIMYFTCKPNVTDNSCTSGCYAGDRTWVNCQQPNDYVAQYQVLSISIGSMSGTTPVQSINNWIVFQQRIDGSVDFNRNWNDYVNGFGDLVNIWLGLEKIYQLTSTGPCKLRFELQATSNGKWFSAEYGSFTLDSSWNFYTIHVSGYSGDASDGLNAGPPTSIHNNMKFTTNDSDNDNCYLNCATNYGGSGFWYNCCMYMNFNEPYNSYRFYYHPLVDFGGSDTMQIRTSRMMLKFV